MKIKNENDTLNLIGEFSIDGGVAIITDPCYSLKKLHTRVSNVKNGVWKGYVYRKIDPRVIKNRDERIASLEKLQVSDDALASLLNKISDDEVLVKAIKSQRESSKKEIEALKNCDFGRVSMLLAYHESINPNDDDKWKLISNNVGVDSGQMSICGLDYWKENPLHEGGKAEFVNGEFKRNRDGRYWKVCDLTGGSLSAGIFDNAALVSQSGWGDGQYDAFSLVKNGVICGLAVKFIDDSSED